MNLAKVHNAMMRKVAAYLPSFLDGVSRGIKNSVSAVPDTLGAVVAKGPGPSPLETAKQLNPAAGARSMLTATPPAVVKAVKDNSSLREALRQAGRQAAISSGVGSMLGGGLRLLRPTIPGAAPVVPTAATKPAAGAGNVSGR